MLTNLPKPSARVSSELLVLDFLNAIEWSRRDKAEPNCDNEKLLRWMEEAELVPPDTIRTMRSRAAPGELEAVTVQAKALGTWFQAFVDDFKGKPLPPNVIQHLQPLNRILQRDVQVLQIDVRDNLNDRIAGSGLKWSTKRIWRSSDMLLLPIAQMMAQLICTEDFSNVRACEGPNCGRLFLDRTQGRPRRWCSMAACGNRARRLRIKNRSIGFK